MNPSQKNLIIVLILLVLALGGSTYYFFSKYYDLRTNPQGVNQEEVNALVAEVAEVIMLPADEMPTIATVSDPELLKDQPFFKNAKKGDRVLIYAQAQRAILYDPVAKKVIEVAPVNIGPGELPSAPVDEGSNEEPAEESEQ